MAKEKKKTGSEKKMDEHANRIISVLESIDSHLAAMVYYQRPSSGVVASVDKHVAAPYISESEALQEKIEKLVIESLKELERENR